MTDDFITQLLAYKGLAIAVWLAVFFTVERLAPAAVNPTAPLQRLPRVLRNLGLFLVNSGVSVLFVVPVTVFAAAHALDWRPADWQGGAGVLLADLLLLDLFIYWWHRANHEIPFLWRFHEVHHLDQFLDSTSAVRFHFIEVILSACVRGVFIVLLDVPLAHVLVFEGLVLLSSIFQHSNIRLPKALDRALSYIIVTPGWHWMHHHAVRADTDSNYTNTLTLWDRLFGSACPHRRRLTMPIGVERKSERPFLRLILEPLYKG